ncbi:MAG: hypothetical protein KJ956_05465 [Actinobacteria bacterium]|nr:hypothetical protein [Actinomycetota bacterium]
MTLLGEMALAFLVESIALAALWLAMGAAAGFLVGIAAGARPRRLADLKVPALAGLAGAVVTASLSVRFGAPVALLLDIGRRRVPILWSLGGALAGALAALLVERRTGMARSGAQR